MACRWPASKSNVHWYGYGGPTLIRPTLTHSIVHFQRLFPHIEISGTVQPITRTVLRVTLQLYPEFAWADRYHGGALSWHVWVTDAESELILHAERFTLTRSTMGDEHSLCFSIPVREPLPPQYLIHAMSDRFLACETVFELSFHNVVLPHHQSPHTELLDLHPLPITACHDAAFESIFSYSHFNPIQTQAFHVLGNGVRVQ